VQRGGSFRQTARRSSGARLENDCCVARPADKSGRQIERGIAVPKSRTANPENVRLPIGRLCRRYGVTARTVSRWLDNEQLGFPRPIVINRRRYWDEAMLAIWDRQQVSRKSDRCDEGSAAGSNMPASPVRNALTGK
jgi:hypothetical protein